MGLVSGPTSKSTWKTFERKVAATDWGSKRNPLSGANSRDDDGNPRSGDVIIPKKFDVIAECKLRSSFIVHTLFKALRADAKKAGKTHPLLYTKLKHEHGWLVTLEGATFSQILKVPEVQKLFTRLDCSAQAVP